MLLVPFLLHAQAAQTPKAKGPTDERPPADLTGVWYPSSGSTLGAATPDNPGQQFVWLDSEGKPLKGPLPLTAWGQERLKANHPTGPKTSAIDSDDPDFQCFPSGVPRIYLFLYPMEIIHTPGRVLMLFEHGHNIRQIFTDGRGHLQDAEPSWMGDSIGHWEGDTLVVDTIGYNDKFWIDGKGTPHTEQMHTIERYTRPNFGTLLLDLTLDDPGAFTRPIEYRFEFKAMSPGVDLMEFICLEDNEYGIAGGFTPADENGEKEKAKQQGDTKK